MDIFTGRTFVLTFLIASCFIINSQCETLVEGCSSHCHPAFDSTLECFNKTLKFFETSLFGVMRNYVRSEINVATSRKNKVPYTKEELVTRTVNVMNTVQPMDIEDEGGVLNADQAKPIVQSLVDNVQALLPSKGFLSVECPIACEKSDSPFSYIIYGSMGLNLILFVLGLILIFISEKNIAANIRMETDILVTKEELKIFMRIRVL
ncbi:unnamed protein product [Auanema sp. JU1783]|nr:unnamed protein product [Auanema sp. JU1783]